MKVGLFFDLRRPPGTEAPWRRTYSFALEVCEEAERLGAASVWFSEHHLYADGYLPQPLTFAAAVAARTTRVRIGTAVMIAGLRHPVHVAEEAAVVDQISGGRLELGFGAGYRRPEHDLFGVDFTQRYRLADRRVSELREIWASGSVTPPPVQDVDGGIPLWVGYNGPKGARRAGRLGVGLLSSDPKLASNYLDGLTEGGYDPAVARMAGMVPVYVTDDPEGDWPEISRRHAYQWDSYLAEAVKGTDVPPPPPLDMARVRGRGLDWRSGSLLYATPEEAATQLRQCLVGLPVDTIFLWASVAGMPEDLVHRNVTTILCRLAPLLADA